MPAGELVRESLQWLIQAKALAYKYNGFLQCIDTLKDKQYLEDLNSCSDEDL